jgi:hypothetical protein
MEMIKGHTKAQGGGKPMKVKELVVVPHSEGLLIVCYPNGKKTQEILLTKEQALFLAAELMNTLYKMGYRPPADPVTHLSDTG